MAHPWITSKTHLYIKVRYYASEYHLRGDWQDRPKSRKARWDASRLYSKFYESFVDKFSGTNTKYLRTYFMHGFQEVSKEIIHEVTGVNICCAGGVYIYCIPKTKLGYKIYKWILENCVCKHELIKKTVGTYMDPGVQTWTRDSYKTRPDILEKLLSQ